MHLIGAALSALVVVAASAAGAQTPAEPTMEEKAAGLAGYTLIEGCLFRLAAAKSAEDYAQGSTELGRQMKADPAMSASPVTVEGVDGRTCRVAYQGPKVGELWTSLAGFGAAKQNSGCVQTAATANRAALSCKAAKDSPAYDEVLERTGEGATARFSGSITYRGPGLP